MPVYTPILGLPYVQGTDTPISYPTTNQELVTKLESEIGAVPHGRIEWGDGGSVPAGMSRINHVPAMHAEAGMTFTNNALTVLRPGVYLIAMIVGTSNAGLYSLQLNLGSTAAVTVEGSRISAPGGADVGDLRATSIFLRWCAANDTLAPWVYCTITNWLQFARLEATYLHP